MLKFGHFVDSRCQWIKVVKRDLFKYSTLNIGFIESSWLLVIFLIDQVSSSRGSPTLLGIRFC